MIQVMNSRATRIANGGREDQLQAEFNELLNWTRNATPENLELFNADDDTTSPQKRLYSLLTANTRRRRR